jgi:hypothetical protein
MNKVLKIAIPLFLILAMALVAGCASSAPVPTAPSPPRTAMPAPNPSPAAAPQMLKDTGVAESSVGGAGDIQPGADRKIIRTGQITLEIADIAKSMESVATVATDLGGYVVSSNRYGNEDKASGRVTIRVPANRFSEAFIKLRNLAVKVPNESTNSQDVTEEYTDLQARLRNLEATEAQFLSILEKSKTVDEILKVQREISNVRGQIEQVKGRIKYLDRTTDMSLIEVLLQESKTVGKDGWNALETLKGAVNGLIAFGKVLVDIIIWLIIFCPLWIIIGVIIFLVRRHRRKKANIKA